ncbi:MAG: type transport system permease protein [Solirubrobacteraceae bacterium]|jgi:ABC-2 type transport system permease protein|nr:type transport system permease protein [Solirubrobacteraceae bacterium]
MSTPAATTSFPVSPEAREMRGPSAYGGGWRRFVNLTWIIGLTEYRLTYFGSVLGYLWSLMRPLMLFGVLYVVFSQIVKFGDQIPNYPVLLLFNIVLFNFFSDSTQRAVTAVVDSEGIVRKMHFPRLVIPLSTVLTGALNLFLSLFAVFVFLLAYGVSPRWTWLLLPLLILPLIAITAAVSMIVSSLYVRFRDVAPIWFVASTIMFYGSPVLYAIDTVPDASQRYLLFNPIAMLLEQGRKWVIDPSARGAIDAIGGWGWALVPIAVFAALCALGVWLFDREAPAIAERL